MKLRLSIAALSAFAILFTAGGFASAEAKVGFINLQRLVSESQMGKEAQEDIRALREDKEALLGVRLQELKKMKEEMDKNGAAWDSEVRRSKTEELQKAYKEYQRLVADSKEDIEREDRDLVAIILEKADAVLKKVAKERGYTIIIKDANAIGYLDESVDITDAVLEELNK